MNTRLKSSIWRHHMSISVKWDSSFSAPKMTTRREQVLQSMAVFKTLCKYKCSVLLDSGHGTSRASTLLIDKINKRPSKGWVWKTDITMHVTIKNYHVDVSNIGGYHSFQLKVRNSDKRILLLYQTEKQLYKTVCEEKN